MGTITNDLFVYRNIHAFEAEPSRAQTLMDAGKRLPLGGWIYQIHVDDEGTIQRCGRSSFRSTGNRERLLKR